MVMAGALLAVGPLLLVFSAIAKNFIGNATEGAIRG
jgi:ABC-type maltose transport system permease subunit